MDVQISQLCDADLALMAGKMRPMDLFEFDVMTGGVPPIDTLRHLLARSRRARAAYIDGELVAVYGVLSQTLLDKSGNPWLAATDMIDRPAVRRAFIASTRSEAAYLARGFSHLWNMVSEDNLVAIRWLKWVGFVFDGTSYDIRGHRFLKFHVGE